MYTCFYTDSDYYVYTYMYIKFLCWLFFVNIKLCNNKERYT